MAFPIGIENDAFSIARPDGIEVASGIESKARQARRVENPDIGIVLNRTEYRCSTAVGRKRRCAQVGFVRRAEKAKLSACSIKPRQPSARRPSGAVSQQPSR